jgi:hypothetical protein
MLRAPYIWGPHPTAHERLVTQRLQGARPSSCRGGSLRALVHKPLEEITDDELPRKQLYAQTWQFSEARHARHLGPIPRRSFDVTVRDTIIYRRPAVSK